LATEAGKRAAFAYIEARFSHRRPSHLTQRPDGLRIGSTAVIQTEKLGTADLVGRVRGHAVDYRLSAHFVSRVLRALGHEPRIIPAIYVKPFLKGQKNDYNDAEAIAEAALRPNLRVVQEKSQDQLDLQACHRVRSQVGHCRQGRPARPWAASTDKASYETGRPGSRTNRHDQRSG
jgi:transposase